MTVAVYGYGLAALAHTALALRLVPRTAPHRRSSTTASLAFFGAICATAAWSWATVLAIVLAAPSSATVASLVAALCDLLRYGLWLFCLAALLRTDGSAAGRPKWPVVAATLLVSINLIVWLAWLGGAFPKDADPRPVFSIALALPVLGLVLTEQLYRNATDDSRWSSKPFCLALALAFVFDIYFYSQAALFGQLDADAVNVRGVVHAGCAPLLWIASRRQVSAPGALRVSRVAAFHTAALVLVGLYLLFLSSIGYYVRESGGDWGRALQLGLVFVGGAALIFIVSSGAARARLRVEIGKHFFAYRYDYRAEWLRFTDMLAGGSARSVGELVTRGLADMVESPAGSLWSRTNTGDEFVQVSRWNMAQIDEKEAAGSPLCLFLREKGWIIDLGEVSAEPERYGALELPEWLESLPSAWILIPLQIGDELLGFVVLARPRTPLQINWEVRDLLKTASRQAAGFLAQVRSTEALLDARKFESFNRMSAFVVHDLKNIVTQLSLMLKNAKRLHANPEFQQDMLLTVENSLEKMRQLILQLREGEMPTGSASGVDLDGVARRIAEVSSQRGRTLDLQLIDRISTRGHENRIERVLGHVVQNAFDATPADGLVWLRLERASGQAKVVIGDTGCGMTQEFVHTRLFRPFSTTKDGGMGIGAYESLQYLRELGGSIDVTSRIGEGTVVTVLLPLFDSQHSAEVAEMIAK